MIEYVPYIFNIALSLVVGLLAIFLYKESQKFGLALIGVAFFLSAVPSIVHLAMGGPYLVLRLRDQGYTPSEAGQFMSLLFLFTSTIQVASAITVIAGLVRLKQT